MGVRIPCLKMQASRMTRRTRLWEINRLKNKTPAGMTGGGSFRQRDGMAN